MEEEAERLLPSHVKRFNLSTANPSSNSSGLVAPRGSPAQQTLEKENGGEESPTMGNACERAWPGVEQH